MTEWRWVQPRDQEELLKRLADARDLAVPERERENLCACAYTEIKKLVRDALDLYQAGCTESARADAVEAEIPPLRKRMSDAEAELERVKPFWEAQLTASKRHADALEALLQEYVDDETYSRVPGADFPTCKLCGAVKANKHDAGCLGGRAEAILRHGEA